MRVDSPAEVSSGHRSPHAPESVSRRRGLILLMMVLVAGLVTACAVIASSALAGSAPGAGPGSRVDPTVADGVLDVPATLDEIELPAVARIDPALLAAVVQAADAAAADGILLEVTSGWRSVGYQRWLFDDAVEQYGSVDAARRLVATPETSSHVTGKAVDIGPVDAQFWLMEHGPAWGLCQIYANERWHFELATEPGGVCPALRADAAG